MAVIGPYPASRHLIPSVEPETVTQVSRFFGNGTGTMTTTTTTSPVRAGGGGAATGYDLLLAISVIVLALIILFLVQALRSPGPPRGRDLWMPATPGPPGRSASLLGYRYPGLKGEIRRLIEAMISMASRAGVRVSPGMTVREVAERARGLGLTWALEAYRLYYEGVFSPRPPREGLVKRLRRMVRGEG